MKTVIVSLNSQYIHSSLAPWYLLTSVRELNLSSLDIKVVEGTVNETVEQLYLRIEKEKADVIAFSCYIWNIEYVLKLSAMLKRKNRKIIVGGPEVSYCAKKILFENKSIDYVLSGEGEYPFSALLDALIYNKKLSAIDGLSFRRGRKIIVNEPFVTDKIPISPYCEEYLSSLGGRIAYLETSRGCPFSCAFCLSGRCGNVRYFPIDRAKNDIIRLANSGSKIIKLVDRTFNANRKRAYELWKFIIDNYDKKIPNDVCFHFEIAGDLLTDEDFELLKKAPRGAIQFEIGMQSFNEKTLEAVNRKTNTEKLKNNISCLIKMGNIHIHIDLIAGLPLEDYKSFRNSFNTAFNLNADMLQLGFLKLLYGADMREKRDKYPCKFSENPPYEVASTPWLDEERIKQLHFCENALERFVNCGRFPLTVKYIFETQKRNPFDTLTELGMFTGVNSCTLNEYVDKLFWFFGQGSDIRILRDLLVCDISTSVKSRVLPSSLIIEDKQLRQFRRMLEENPETKRKKGVLRNTFLLYSEECGGYVDYDKKKSDKYILNKIKFDIK
ncbi:MAG: DUF4080 domain-containing protein [Acutalibacteraceae bacterium]|nr:DUF4080 domain-containing protein [Acutalibacteraceae bacterium]